MTTASPPSLLRWPKAVVLLIAIGGILWVVGQAARFCVAEVGVYLYDDDLVAGGRYAASVKQPESGTRLKMIWISALSYDGSYGHLPVNGDNVQHQVGQHSWLTWALMYSWQSGVHQHIDMHKHWDDPANFDSFRRRVKDYEIPNRNLPRFDERGYALSHIAGNEQLLGHEKPTLADIKDGTSNTVLAGTAAGNYEPWGKPGHLRDLTRGISRTPEGFGSPWNTGAIVVMADGSVKLLSNDTSPQVLKALASPAGGEAFGEY